MSIMSIFCFPFCILIREGIAYTLPHKKNFKATAPGQKGILARSHTMLFHCHMHLLYKSIYQWNSIVWEGTDMPWGPGVVALISSNQVWYLLPSWGIETIISEKQTWPTSMTNSESVNFPRNNWDRYHQFVTSFASLVEMQYNGKNYF